MNLGLREVGAGDMPHGWQCTCLKAGSPGLQPYNPHRKPCLEHGRDSGQVILKLVGLPAKPVWWAPGQWETLFPTKGKNGERCLRNSMGSYHPVFMGMCSVWHLAWYMSGFDGKCLYTQGHPTSPVWYLMSYTSRLGDTCLRDHTHTSCIRYNLRYFLFPNFWVA